MWVTGEPLAAVHQGLSLWADRLSTLLRFFLALCLSIPLFYAMHSHICLSVSLFLRTRHKSD